MANFLDHIKAIDPDRPAVWDADRQVSFGEMLTQARAIAQSLKVTFPDPKFVLFEAHRSVDFVVRLFAVWEAGKVPVPVDPDAPGALRKTLLAKCQPGVFINTQDWPEPHSVVRQETLVSAGSEEALVVFTSGTSGQPKGVVVTQKNLCHSASVISEYLGYAQFSRAAVILPLHYSYALISQLLATLYVGGSCFILSNMRNPLKLAEEASRASLQSLCAVPSTFQTFIQFRKMAELSFPEIRVVCSAGAKLDTSLISDIRSLFPNATLFDNYGMTEATPRVTYIKEDDDRFGDGTCGKAIPGMEIRIVDPKTRQPLPEGETGCVAVRGASVMPGYLDDAEANAKAFTDDGFFVSGDLAHLDDGYLYISGRADEVFNVGGEKVSPLEVEAALYKYPAIVECAVAAIEDAARGAIPAAFLVSQSEFKKAEIVAHLREHLPSNKIPVRYYIVESLPKTSNGKIQRTKLEPQANYVLQRLN